MFFITDFLGQYFYKKNAKNHNAQILHFTVLSHFPGSLYSWCENRNRLYWIDFTNFQALIVSFKSTALPSQFLIFCIFLCNAIFNRYRIVLSFPL
jgi:hypothetical protein